MNIVGRQILEAPPGAAPKPHARDNTPPAGGASFAAALERCADAVSPQPDPDTAPGRHGRAAHAGDRADEDGAPDATAALLAGVVPQLVLSATQPPAQRQQAGQARPTDGGGSIATTSLPGSRGAMQAVALAVAAGTVSPDTAVDAQAAASGNAAAAPFVPLRTAAPSGPVTAAATAAAAAAAAAAKADAGQAPAEAAASQQRLAMSASIGRRAPAEAAPRGAAALGDGLAAATHARTASAEPAPAAAALAGVPAAAPEADRQSPGASSSLPLALPTRPMAGPLARAGRSDAPDQALAVTVGEPAAAAAAPTAVIAAEHERGSGAHAPDHAESAQPAVTAATSSGVAPGVSAPTPARAEVSAPVGSPEWPAALGQQLARLPQAQEVELHLHPAELGPLKVKLSMQDGQAQLTFVAASPMVRDAIEAALPQLKINLAEHGIGLGQTSVGSGSGQAQAQFGTSHGSSQDQRGQRAPHVGPDRPREPAGAIEAAPHAGPRRGTIDAFV